MALESFPAAVGLRAVCHLGLIMLAVAFCRQLSAARQRTLDRCIERSGRPGRGNFCLVYAETMIASGCQPVHHHLAFWFVGIEALLPGGERLHPRLYSECSSALRRCSAGGSGSGSGIQKNVLYGALLLQVGNACGPLFHLPTPAGGQISSDPDRAVQQLAAASLFCCGAVDPRAPGPLEHQGVSGWSTLSSSDRSWATVPTRTPSTSSRGHRSVYRM